MSEVWAPEALLGLGGSGPASMLRWSALGRAAVSYLGPRPLMILGQAVCIRGGSGGLVVMRFAGLAESGWIGPWYSGLGAEEGGGEWCWWRLWGLVAVLLQPILTSLPSVGMRAHRFWSPTVAQWHTWGVQVLLMYGCNPDHGGSWPRAVLL